MSKLFNKRTAFTNLLYSAEMKKTRILFESTGGCDCILASLDGNIGMF